MSKCTKETKQTDAAAHVNPASQTAVAPTIDAVQIQNLAATGAKSATNSCSLDQEQHKIGVAGQEYVNFPLSPNGRFDGWCYVIQGSQMHSAS